MEYIKQIEQNIYLVSVPPIINVEIAKNIALQLDQTIENSQEKIKIINDLSKCGDTLTKEIKDVITKSVKSHEGKIEKSAVVGLDRYQRIAAKVILLISGRTNIKLFENIDQALDWLK